MSAALESYSTSSALEPRSVGQVVNFPSVALIEVPSNQNGLPARLVHELRSLPSPLEQHMLPELCASSRDVIALMLLCAIQDNNIEAA